LAEEIEKLKQFDPEMQVNNIQKKRIRETAQEVVTPVELELKVDVKQLRKQLEELKKTN
jgi:hypothetical protein